MTLTTANATGGQRHAPVQAMAILLVAYFVWSVHDTVIKLLTADYSAAQIMFFGRLFTIPVALLLVLRKGGLGGLATRRPLTHLLRAGLSTADMLFFVGAITLASLVEAFTISFATPLIMLILARLFLGERPPVRRWLAVALGFIGVLIAVYGMRGSGAASATSLTAALLALGSALTYAGFLVLTRDMTRTESVPALMFWNSLVVMIVMIVLMPPHWRMPTGNEVWLLLFISTTGVVGQLLSTEAFRLGEASLLAPLQYTTLVWAAIAGYLVFGDLPTPMLLLGAAIIIASALYIARDEARSFAARHRS